MGYLFAAKPNLKSCACRCPVNALTSPSEVIRSLSLPPVSTVTVSAAGNLIAVLVSPV